MAGESIPIYGVDADDHKPVAIDGPGVAAKAGSISLASLVPASGNPIIDGLLSGVKWNASTITVQFPQSAGDYGGSYPTAQLSTFQPLTATQQAIFQYGTALIADYTNLNFVAGSPTDAMLRMANYTAPGGRSVAFYPDGFLTSGDLWMGTGNNSPTSTITNPAVGSFNWITHLHEMGHALGLSHGHENGILDGGTATLSNGTLIPNTGPLPFSYDNWNYSIMTYRSYSGAPTGSVQSSDGQTSYMPADILALQYMYGANYSGSSSGNDTYAWDMSGNFFRNGGNTNLTQSTGKIFHTIWDGGGTDTYDLRAFTTNQTISLQPGEFSTFNAAQLADLDNVAAGVQAALGNVANAFLFNGDTRSLIENVMTGSGNDFVIGNLASNTIQTGAGNDIINPLQGSDFMSGGTGNDTYLVDVGGDQIFENAGEGTDTVFTFVDDNMPNNVEVIGLYDAADFALGNSLGNIMIGNLNNDILSGAGGDDQLWGGGGNDTLAGGTGNDFIVGGTGTNSMSGGTGDDQFVVSTSGDTISENFGEGNDTVWATASYILSPNIETLALLYIAAPINGFGNDQNNTLIGTSDANVLYGNGGNDFLIGGDGHDIFFGGTGNDTINAGPGFDVLIFSSPLNDYDFVLDFNTFDDNFLFTGSNYGIAAGSMLQLGFNLFVNSAPIFVTPSFTINTTNGIISFDYDGAGTGAAPLQIAVLSNNAAVDVSDFVFV